MKVYKNQFENERTGKLLRGVALGNFDGIHIGHSQLINTLLQECKKRNLQSCIYTFENHPNNIIFKEKHTPLILDINQKTQIIESMGADELFLECFDEKYAATEPEDFVKKILVDKLNVKLVVVGFDYSFGRFGKGNVSALKDMGVKFGFDVIIIPRITAFLPKENIEVTVSSTVLRELIQKGNMTDFKALTGRNYQIPGVVQCGRKVGKSLGFPTANILPKEGFALPEFGVYATITHVGNNIYRSITNIGNNPTFKEIQATTIETFLIGFEGELYGQDIKVEFIKKIRNEITFKSAEDLVNQISNDLAERIKMNEWIQKVYEGNGVEIFYIPTDQFKSSIIKIMFCDNLSKESAYKNTLLVNILASGTETYTTPRDMYIKYMDLYNTNIVCNTLSRGEVQACEFRAEYVDKKYLPQAPMIEDDVIDFLFEIIFKPLTETVDGKTAFSSEVFNRERENHNNNIKSLINNKSRYAFFRFKEFMFENEAYSVNNSGKAEDGDSLTPILLYDYYKNVFLKKLPVKIIYSGKEYPVKLTEYTKKFFSDSPKIQLQEAYIERPEIKPEDVRDIEEKHDVTQGILYMGYRTNTPPLSEEYYATLVCIAILGQMPKSKLFVNVREKNSLAYYADSQENRIKGVMFVSCGIDCDKKDTVINIVTEQLELMKKGDITNEEFSSAKKMICDDLYSHKDNQEQLMSYFFNQNIMGKVTDVLEYIERIKAVKTEDVIAAADRIQLDTIYFLKEEEDNA